MTSTTRSAAFDPRFDGQIPLWEPPSSFVQYGARVHNYEGDTALVALDTPMAVPLDPRVEMRDEAWVRMSALSPLKIALLPFPVT